MEPGRRHHRGEITVSVPAEVTLGAPLPASDPESCNVRVGKFTYPKDEPVEARIREAVSRGLLLRSMTTSRGFTKWNTGVRHVD